MLQEDSSAVACGREWAMGRGILGSEWTERGQWTVAWEAGLFLKRFRGALVASSLPIIFLVHLVALVGERRAAVGASGCACS